MCVCVCVCIQTPYSTSTYNPFGLPHKAHTPIISLHRAHLKMFYWPFSPAGGGVKEGGGGRGKWEGLGSDTVKLHGLHTA